MKSTVRVLPTWQMTGSLLLALELGGSITVLVTLLSVLPRPALECRPKGLLAGRDCTRERQLQNHKRRHKDPVGIFRSSVEIRVKLIARMAFKCLV